MKTEIDKKENIIYCRGLLTTINLLITITVYKENTLLKSCVINVARNKIYLC